MSGSGERQGGRRSHRGCVAGDGGMGDVLQHDRFGTRDKEVWRQGHRVGASHVAPSGSRELSLIPARALPGEQGLYLHA